MATSGPVPLVSQVQQRKPQTYTPSPWGDFFLHHIPCTPSQYLMMKDKVKIMKEEVKKMLLDADSFDLSDKLDCIDTLERLGLDYHYTKEIDKLMCNFFEARDQDLDLLTTSYLFYLLRKHGYHISSDVFLKFRDDKGNIVTDDAKCLLRMYEAAHLRVKGEEVLDNILIFTKRPDIS
ncbi:(E)-beta-caryophyllene synthase-like [Miscanthus floridulus]|uniref:(E)-beta-caryophyllene synthase-like n=1 Tax=Miscanthus floridulus TaxID=154761 RepID=UPI003459765B